MAFCTGGHRKSRGLDFGQFSSGFIDGRFSGSLRQLVRCRQHQADRQRASATSENQKFQLTGQANQCSMGHLGCFQGECNVRPVFRARRDFEAQWRFQKKLRQGFGRNSLSALRQCRARTFLVLGRLGFLRLFRRVGLAGAAWLDEVNLALMFRISSFTVSTRTALWRAKAPSESVR